ncbi:hypothetical protein C8R46DRAFT_1256048 [Mycena filopes]|nr:hypothetical protein C8R46DRAFT_1256048 [Mycena filopes]
MVAVKSTFLALSLASISLVDAAAINTPPPSPMKRMIRERADSTAKKTAPLGEAFSKRQKEQARFEVRHVEERRDEVNSTAGRVDITNPTTNGSTTLGSLLYNNATDEFDSSPDQHSTIYMAPYNTQSSEVALKMPINGTSYCITYDPNPPAPAPLYAEPCFNESTAATSNSSQKFRYDSDDGTVTPVWSANNSTGVAQRAASQEDRLVFVRNDAAAREAVESASSSSSSTSVSTSVSQPSQSTSSAPVAPPKPPVGLPAALPVTPPARQAESASASSTSQSASTPSASSTLPVAAPKPPVGVTSVLPVRQAASASASQSQSDSLAPSQSASIVAQESDAASSTTASSSATPTAGAFEVELASSSASSAASPSSLDASAVADDIVTSAASDSSTSSSAPTSISSVSPPTGQEQQAVYVGREAREEMVPVSTEPYTWKFSAESREW